MKAHHPCDASSLFIKEPSAQTSNDGAPARPRSQDPRGCYSFWSPEQIVYATTDATTAMGALDKLGHTDASGYLMPPTGGGDSMQQPQGSGIA